MTWATELAKEAKRPLYVFSIPGLSLTLCSFHPLTLITGGSALLPILQTPKGASQQVDELTGHSSISQLTITANDPGGQLKQVAANDTAIGQVCALSLGFPGIDLSEFITLHTGTITDCGRTEEGLMTFQVGDLNLNLVNDIFLNGGPDAWTPGQAKHDFPLTPNALLDNGQPISIDNPRYLSGNCMDILLAVLQNELGIGQSTPPVLVANTGGGSGTGQAGYAINPAWTFYDGTSGLINPNTYVDAPGIIALRDGQFSGDRMEFTITGSQGGKAWVEDLLKSRGLYWITKSNGQLALKSMKHPAAPSITAIGRNQIKGVPVINRWPAINIIQGSLPAGDGSAGNTAAVPFAQQTSLGTYKAPYVHTLASDGLRQPLGGYGALFLTANRTFNRHAFATPEYTFTTFLTFCQVQLGDFFSLTHSLLLNLKSGTLGVNAILCEVTDRTPDYAAGTMTFKVADTRFMDVPNGAFLVADVGTAPADWAAASAGEKATLMFVSDNSGLMSDGTAANEIA